MCGAFSGRATSTAAVGVVHDSFISYSDGRRHRWSHNPFCVNGHDIFQNSTAEQRQFNETPSQRHVFCGKRHATASSVATRTGAGAHPEPGLQAQQYDSDGAGGRAELRGNGNILCGGGGNSKLRVGRTRETAAPPCTKQGRSARTASHPIPPHPRKIKTLKRST